MNVHHKFSTLYYPQINELTENFNETLINVLRKVIINYPIQWDQWLHTTLYVYRTKVHTTMKYSPYELLFEIIPKGINYFKLIEQPLGEECYTLLNYK